MPIIPAKNVPPWIYVINTNAPWKWLVCDPETCMKSLCNWCANPRFETDMEEKLEYFSLAANINYSDNACDEVRLQCYGDGECRSEEEAKRERSSGIWFPPSGSDCTSGRVTTLANKHKGEYHSPHPSADKCSGEVREWLTLTVFRWRGRGRVRNRRFAIIQKGKPSFWNKGIWGVISRSLTPRI